MHYLNVFSATGPTRRQESAQVKGKSRPPMGA